MKRLALALLLIVLLLAYHAAAAHWGKDAKVCILSLSLLLLSLIIRLLRHHQLRNWPDIAAALEATAESDPPC